MMHVGSLTRGSAPTVDVAVIPFEEVYLLYSDRVYRFCVSLLRDSSDAEDVTANTFMAAYAAYSRVRPPSTELKPWLFRIARNASIDQLRRRARAGRLLDVLRLSRPARHEAESVAVIRDELREVVTAIATLRRRERELVGMRVAGELSYAEIGAVLGISEQAAKSATRRALARLGDRLKRTP